jgi:anti-anti-sigma regulatory factor
MLRTRRTENGQVLFTLSGRIETEDIKQLQELFAAEISGQQLILDLKDVTLVNEDAVKFLGKCEAEGVKLENSPLHVRDWVNQVKDRPKRRRE